MGTSTTYSGSPKWGAAKTETTRVGGEGFVTPQKAASIVSSFVNQMLKAPQLGFGPSLSGASAGTTASSAGAGGPGPRGGSRGGGGGGAGGGGGSSRTSRLGGSPRAVARGIGAFLSDVGTKGFREALAERGLTDLTGKSPDEVAFALADLLGGPSSLIEQTALRDALLELVLQWSENAKEVDDFEQSVSIAASNIEDALHDFFGHYIFEVFKTVGYQGVLAAHGFEKAQSMAGQIRDFISAKIDAFESKQSLSDVDWNGPRGAAVVDAIVADTIEIFGEVQP